MNTERQPLLMDVEVQGKSARPRPDIRCSPESTLVDVKSEDEGNLPSDHFIKYKLIIFVSYMICLQGRSAHSDQKIRSKRMTLLCIENWIIQHPT